MNVIDSADFAAGQLHNLCRLGFQIIRMRFKGESCDDSTQIALLYLESLLYYTKDSDHDWMILSEFFYFANRYRLSLMRVLLE